MMLKRVTKVFNSLVLAGMLIPSTILATTGTVTGNSVRIRKEANSKSIEVSLATKGEKVEVIGENGDWYNVKFENVTGYISKEYVSTDYTSSSSENKSENLNSEKTDNTSQDNVELNETKPSDTETKTEESNESNSGNKVEDNNELTSKDKVNDGNEINLGDKIEDKNELNSENKADDKNESNPENKIEENNISTSEDTSKDYKENQTIQLEQDVSLRYLPSFTSRVQATATKDSTYTVKAVLNNWIKISNENNSGWILKTNIEVKVSETEDNNKTENNKTENDKAEENQNSSEPVTSNNTQTQENSTTETIKGKVNVPSAVLRKSPNGEKIDSLPKGTEVTILGEENDWYKIKTTDYESCYIAKRLITKK